MKIKDLKALNGCWDVYGNIADEIAVAFENDGKEWLSDEGKEHFKDVLEIGVEIYKDIIFIKTDEVIPSAEADKYEWDGYESYHPTAQKLSDLFWGYAGYCSEEDYAKWFIEN